jgi:hypothetical protein
MPWQILVGPAPTAARQAAAASCFRPESLEEVADLLPSLAPSARRVRHTTSSSASFLLGMSAHIGAVAAPVVLREPACEATTAWLYSWRTYPLSSGTLGMIGVDAVGSGGPLARMALRRVKPVPSMAAEVVLLARWAWPAIIGFLVIRLPLIHLFLALRWSLHPAPRRHRVVVLLATAMPGPALIDPIMT